MLIELQEYLREDHLPSEITRFIKDLVDSPSAEDVYYQMSLAISDLSRSLNTVRKKIDEITVQVEKK